MSSSVKFAFFIIDFFFQRMKNNKNKQISLNLEKVIGYLVIKFNSNSCQAITILFCLLVDEYFFDKIRKIFVSLSKYPAIL